MTPRDGVDLPRVLHLCLFVALLASAACGTQHVSASPRADRNVITEDQIRENGFRTAYEAVEVLRKPWLTVRPDGLTPERTIQVYLDNSRLGGVERLREISAAQIALIRYIDPATAINRWGVDHGQGVIMVISRK